MASLNGARAMQNYSAELESQDMIQQEQGNN